MSIIKNFKPPQPFIASIIIACILTGYNIPILIASSQDLLNELGVLSVLTILTSLVVYLLSVNTLLVRVVTIPLVMISSVFLYFILFYKIKIYPPIMTAIFETDSTEAFELLSINLILWIFIFGFVPSYLIIKLTKDISKSKKNRFILYSVVILLAIMLKFNIFNLYLTLRPVGKSFKTNCPLLHPSYVFNKYLPYSYIYNTKLHVARSLNYIDQKKKT
ncbi:MAG: DUF1705 domain-containing protein [Rickettsiales bacterium]|nr:DUF1705 domain-containing protein [Rickettsiales bacterium]